jgi:Flp pilus assembly protein TadB
MSIERVVVLLTPIFVGLSGWVAELAVRYLPGTPALDRGELTAVFIAGMTAAATAAVKWLHGRSQHTQNEQKQELEVALAEVRNAPVAGLAAAQTAGVSPAVPARRRRTPKPPAAAVAVPQMGLLLAAAAAHDVSVIFLIIVVLLVLGAAYVGIALGRVWEALVLVVIAILVYVFLV